MVVTDIYAAGEEPIAGVTGESLAQVIADAVPKGCEVSYVPSIDQAAERVHAEFKPGDLVISMGAGSITRLPDMLIQKMSR